MKFIITVDTEADNQWSRDTGDITLQNLRFLPRFQELCERFHYTPTYLVTYEVLMDASAVAMLKTWQMSGKAEIGAHLHPWTTPPLTDKDFDKRFPSELTDSEFKEKLTVLTEKIEREIGVRPTSYRAGRWGFDVRHIKSMLELGYVVDSSMSPKVNWRQTIGAQAGRGGPDFRATPITPHYYFSTDVLELNTEKLLEVPMTILHTGLVKKEGNLSSLFSRLPDGFVKKIFNRLLFKTKWLRIFPETSETDWEGVYKSSKENGLPVIQFMIHSSELMPGGSPYAKTPEMVEQLYSKLEKMFTYFTKNDLTGVTLSDFARKYN